MKSRLSILVLLALNLAGLQAASAQVSNPPDLATPQEKHLRNVHQLTFGGQNAEAYFSADGKKLIFQSSHGDVKCDQIFIMNIDGSDQHMVSTGKGRTTCSFFYPDGKKNSLRLHPSGEPGVPSAP
jgi:TolB protein